MHGCMDGFIECKYVGMYVEHLGVELKHPEMPHFPDSGPREGPDLNC